MNRDLFLAILAMDAYNRGYRKGMKIDGDSSSSELGGFIGNARIKQQSDVLPNEPGVNASLYAIAYELDGEKIISYRSTDDKVIDPLTGWDVGLGSAVARQAQLAVKFYNAVLRLTEATFPSPTSS